MSEWLDLAEAPLEQTGHLWDPSDPDRTHIGFVYDYGNGQRGASSSSRGFNFTKWHAFPHPPVVHPTQIDDRKVHLAHCNQGDYEGGCKYGEDDMCPALHT